MNVTKKESDLRCIASILILGHCRTLSCEGSNNEPYIEGNNKHECPFQHKKDCNGFDGSDAQLSCDINNWMEDNNITKADLFEYMFE